MSAMFKAPPINEVIVSSYFKPPLAGFRSEHIGLFWERIKRDFPTVKQQLPVGPIPAIEDEPFPMPRYWFIADDEVNFIQIQKNAFILNWRRRESNEYPRYRESIKPAFDKYYGFFSEFIQTEFGEEKQPTIDFCELAYINVLESCDFWRGIEDTAKVIPSFPTLSPGVGSFKLAGFNCNYFYDITEDLQLSIDIRNGLKARQPDTPALIFEIKASGRIDGGTKAIPDEWFQRAHDAIIECFLCMTDADIQKKHWILENAS